MISISSKIYISDDEYELSYSRSSGPGGQNVNKVNSKATLKWNIARSKNVPLDVISRFRIKNENRINNEGEFVIQSDAYRDQTRNADDCRKKISDLIREVLHPPKKRKPTKPSKNQVQARLDRKKIMSEKKQSRRWRPD